MFDKNVVQFSGSVDQTYRRPGWTAGRIGIIAHRSSEAIQVSLFVCEMKKTFTPHTILVVRLKEESCVHKGKT